jgi:hypothetical protein
MRRPKPYGPGWRRSGSRRTPTTGSTTRAVAHLENWHGLPTPESEIGFTTAGRRELGRIVSVDPGTQLTGTIMGGFMSYVLMPHGPGTTRLLLKVVMATTRWAAPLLSTGDLIMARRQLLNLKHLAERHQG